MAFSLHAPRQLIISMYSKVINHLFYHVILQFWSPTLAYVEITGQDVCIYHPKTPYKKTLIINKNLSVGFEPTITNHLEMKQSNGDIPMVSNTGLYVIFKNISQN